MTQIPAQASQGIVITAHEKLFPIVILLEAAMVTVVPAKANQKGTTMKSKEHLRRFPKSLSKRRLPTN